MICQTFLIIMMRASLRRVVCLLVYHLTLLAIIYLLLLFIGVGERGHKQAGCSRRRKRRASSEGEGSGSVAAGGAPSAAKTGSAVLTSRTPEERVLELLPVLGDQGVVVMAGLTSALGL